MCTILALLPLSCQLQKSEKPGLMASLPLFCTLDVGARGISLRNVCQSTRRSGHPVDAAVGHSPSALTWHELASLPGSQEDKEEPSHTQDWVAFLAAEGQEQVRRNLKEGGDDSRRSLHILSTRFRELGNERTGLQADPERAAGTCFFLYDLPFLPAFGHNAVGR